MSLPRVHREDRRRELTLWVLFGMEFSDDVPDVASFAFGDQVVGSAPPLTTTDVSPYYRIPRFEDSLPETEEWMAVRDRVIEAIRLVADNRATLDAHLAKASPKWRIDRMPAIDRTLLRMGVAELTLGQRPRARATINGLIELAKHYGEESTPRFVNGILDQVRRNLEIPFE